jgi:hypothetical protein
MAMPIPSVQDSTSQGTQGVRELSIPIYQARGWLKFLGILSIISGIFQAISIAGIIIAWLTIWMGVLMFQAGSNIESATTLGDKFSFLRSLDSLKTYFVLQGVLTLLGILFVLVMSCILFILPLLGLTLIPWQDIINQSYYF